MMIKADWALFIWYSAFILMIGTIGISCILAMQEIAWLYLLMLVPCEFTLLDYTNKSLIRKGII